MANPFFFERMVNILDNKFDLDKEYTKNIYSKDYKESISEYIWNMRAQSMGWKPEITWGYSCLAISLQSISLERFKELAQLLELAFQAKVVAMLMRELSFWKRCAATSRELWFMFAYGIWESWFVVSAGGYWLVLVVGSWRSVVGA